jgi:hypothetical protein
MTTTSYFKSCLTLCISIICCIPSYADVYRWVDEQGTVHFSDSPHLGATPINLPDIQLYHQTHVLTQRKDKAPPRKHAKQRIKIIQPKNQATIRNNQGHVSVSIEIEPKLNEGDKIQVVLDGKPIGESQSKTQFSLKNINRGTHTISATLVDANGQLVASTRTVTIYLHRPRIGMVP